MSIKLRPATPDDAQRCGTICYEAFTAIVNQHNFPPDLPVLTGSSDLDCREAYRRSTILRNRCRNRSRSRRQQFYG